MNSHGHGHIKNIMNLREKSKKVSQNHELQIKSISKQKNPALTRETIENSEALSQQSEDDSLQNVQSARVQSKHPKYMERLTTANSVLLEDSPQPIQRVKSSRVKSRKKIISTEKYSKTAMNGEKFMAVEPKRRKVSQQLQILEPEHFIFQKDYQKVEQQKLAEEKRKVLRCFWAKIHHLVSLFPIEHNQEVIFHNCNILPVYGQVKIQNSRYVVTNEYKHSSLRQLIHEFGPFDEELSKKYLKQICSGLEKMHERNIAHNQLLTENILYDKEGTLFINVVKSSTKPLTEKQKAEELYYHCPQRILSKSKTNSLKSDLWSIGIILLDMLYNFSEVKCQQIPFHPYNMKEDQEDGKVSESILVDNLLQLYTKNFLQSEDSKKPDLQLSQNCQSFIKLCLSLKQRPNVKVLLGHKFLSTRNI